MKCKEIIEVLEQHYPKSAALSWDNVGLLVGSDQKEVQKIFVALDVTDETLEEAVRAGADLMITHHPMLFSPVKRITAEDFIGRRIIRLIQEDIAYYAMHTNFDVKGMADINAEALKLQECTVLEETGTDSEGNPEGIGRAGVLGRAMELEEFASYVKECLNLPGRGFRRFGKEHDSGSAGKGRPGAGDGGYRLSHRNRRRGAGTVHRGCGTLRHGVHVYRSHERAACGAVSHSGSGDGAHPAAVCYILGKAV